MLVQNFSQPRNSPFFPERDKLYQMSTSSGAYIEPRTIILVYSLDTNLVKDINLKTNKLRTSSEQLDDLRKHVGFNISELAKILLIQRPTVYQWVMSQNEPLQKNQARLDAIYDIFKPYFDKFPIPLKVYLRKKVIPNLSLYDLLIQNTLDTPKIRNLLDQISQQSAQEYKKKNENENSLTKTGFQPMSKEHKQKVLNRITRKIS